MRFLFAILLLTVQAHASLILDSCSRNHPIITVVTDASATPTVSKVPVCAGWNGLRIWTGEQALAEASFNLYVSINGGAATTVRMYRWMGRIITANSGDSISLGTVDGRTVYATPMYAPAATETVAGVTATANCDKAGPPLWTPAAAHIILPSNTRAFKINSDGTERDVFIKEYDGSSWTPTRWLRLEAARSVTVRTSYRKIALANYAGATLSVSGALGTVIGGASTSMSLSIPAPTGTTYAVSDDPSMSNALKFAVSGDLIQIAVGATPITSNIVAASFIANVAAGRKGAEGIIFQGAATDYETLCPIVGSWSLIQTGAAGYTYFKDLKFDFTGVASGFSLAAGKFKFEHVRMTGVASSSIATFDFGPSATDTLQLDCLRCQFDTGSEDLINGTGNTANAGSLCRFIDCTGYTAGPATGDQVITTHSGLPVSFYGGTFSDAKVSTMASDSTAGAVFYAFFTTLTAGARNNAIQNVNLFGCNWTTDKNDSVNPATYCVCSRLSSSWGGIFRSGTTSDIRHSCATVSGIAQRVWFSSYAAANCRFNIFSGGTVATVQISNSGGAVGTDEIINNTFISCPIAMGLYDTTMAGAVTNNACKTSGTSMDCVAGSDAIMTKGYNTLDPTVNAAYTPGTGDTTNADAALDSNYIPTASGNCDGTGDPTAVNWVGDTDPFGLVLIYKSSRISRGAREIPAIYSSAFLYPDIW